MLGAPLGTELSELLGEALSESLGEPLGETLTEALGDTLGDTLRDALGEALGEALGDEFKYRRGKPHASALVIDEVERRFSPRLRNVQPPSHFALAMPEPLRESALTASPEKAVECYRAYYNQRKQGFWRQDTWVPAKWSKRDVPEWW